ncbi:MAG: pyridoxal phosphate-dependent aminotransferase [Candidatus Pacebacteria bacterium]|nr:pyridoxal phosphate-dependent aminotransferase [Candidatus Paceibacterota bacterium]
MRNDIVHPGADELTYEIREIVAVGEELKRMGVPIYWENIGDPIAKGRTIPPWIKDIVADLVQHDDSSYGYSPTRGILTTREFIATMRNAEGGAAITPDDILFFNGLGDAIQTSFLYLHPRCRILGPDPAYPTYSSAEGAHADARHLTYDLVPERHWQPDLADIENKVKYNPEIGGILIINPDNPTGTVYTRDTLAGMVDIARRYDLFVMSDEIYSNIVYDGAMVPLSQVVGTVPGIAFKGLSKEVPWPGARCGWIEVYNREKDPVFDRYIKSLVLAKMLEVCSTTLPQKALPRIMSDARYQPHLREVAVEFGRKADLFAEAFKDVPGLIVNKPQGAFYASVVFQEGVLTDAQTLPIADPAVRERIEVLTRQVAKDKRFVYYLMGSTGITVVPLSGMNSHRNGFRLTLLEPDMSTFKDMLATIAMHVTQYVRSEGKQ